MKLVRLWERAGRLVVEEKAGGFLVTNMGTTKNLKEWPAADLAEVDAVLREQSHEAHE